MVCAAGCAAKPVTSLPGPDFTISGKFGIKDGDAGYSARFNWRQSAGDYEIDVWGPLGQGRTRLHGDARFMQVQRGEEVLARGAPENVMAANLGWSLPVHVLPAWMRGEPQAELTFGNPVYDEQGRYTQFAQAGWQVNLSRYQPRDSITTPARIVAQNGARKVTVIVRQYVHPRVQQDLQ